MPFPKPIRPAKGGDSALCGNSSAGQDNDVANVFHDRHEARTKGRFQDMTKIGICGASGRMGQAIRSEEHTSALQSLMRISHAVFCLKKHCNTHVIQPATLTHLSYRPHISYT